MLQVDVLPMRALRLSGTLNAMDVEPLIDEIRNPPQDGAIALHLESLTDISHDAAQLLRQRLDTIWIGQPMYLHVVTGDVAEVLESVGFVERGGWHELLYTPPGTSG